MKSPPPGATASVAGRTPSTCRPCGAGRPRSRRRRTSPGPHVARRRARSPRSTVQRPSGDALAPAQLPRAPDAVGIEVEGVHARRAQACGGKREQAATGTDVEPATARDLLATHHLDQRALGLGDPVLIQHAEESRPVLPEGKAVLLDVGNGHGDIVSRHRLRSRPVRARRRDLAFYAPWAGPTIAPDGRPTGGAEVQVMHLARGLAARDLRVALITYDTNGLPAAVDGVEIVAQWRPLWRPSVPRRLVTLATTIWRLLRSRRDGPGAALGRWDHRAGGARGAGDANALRLLQREHDRLRLRAPRPQPARPVRSTRSGSASPTRSSSRPTSRPSCAGRGLTAIPS